MSILGRQAMRAMRSQSRHWAWTGHVVRKDLVRIAMTKASLRLWVLIEDLRYEVLAPENDAREYGCRNVNFYKLDDAARCRTDAARADLDAQIELRRSKTRNQMQWFSFSITRALCGIGL